MNKYKKSGLTAEQKVENNRKKIMEEITKQIKEDYKKSLPLWDTMVVRPQNPTSNLFYKGINRISLSLAAVKNNYKDPRWVTFNQAVNNGWTVKKGSKGIFCEKWIYTVEKAIKDENGNFKKDESGNTLKETVELIRPKANYFYVFNAEEIEGIPPLEIKNKTKSEMLEIANNLIESSECPIKEIASERAYYNRTNDEIILPNRSAFKDEETFLSAAMHEMAHSTGHQSRLNRPSHVVIKNGIATKDNAIYAKEELTAEVTSVFLSGNLDIKLEGEHFSDRTNYIKYYHSQLEDDPKILAQVARDAEKAADRLYNNYLEYEKTKEKIKTQEKVTENKKEEAKTQNIDVKVNKNTTYSVKREETKEKTNKTEKNKTIKVKASKCANYRPKSKKKDKENERE